MDALKKITVIGDVMCEPPLLAQAKQPNGSYDFLPVFAPLKGLLSEADYVIANLETPLAGEAAGYADSMSSFNTPDAIAEALKAIGVDAVSTANNHCTDRGLEGIRRTNETLDRIGIVHTGTYADPETADRILYVTVGNTKLALIAYTTSNNRKVELDAQGEKQVNMLRPSHGNKSCVPKPQVLLDMQKFIQEDLGRKLSWIENIRLKRALGVPVAYADDLIEEEKWAPYVRRMEAEIRAAKKQADVVCFLPHTGGQFNVEPGKASVYFVSRAVEAGADAVLASHAHTVQRAELRGSVPCFYSLGNVTMWPNSDYVEHSTLPEYGLAAHLYVSGGKIQKTAFSVFKMVQSETEPLTVVPVDELYAQLVGEAKAQLLSDVQQIVLRVAGRADAQICREYPL